MRPIAVLAPLAVVAFVISGCGSDAATSDTSPVDTAIADTAGADTAAPDTTTSGPADASNPAATTSGAGDDGSESEQMFPDVIDAAARLDDDTWTIDATLSSPYDTPERYADAWRVVGPDGTVYGERILTHDHASEQPFTRSESGIEIPSDVTEVVVEGRDLEFGYGGRTFALTLPS